MPSEGEHDRSRTELSIEEVDPASADARHCLFAYADELNERFPEGYERSSLLAADAIRASGKCLVARQGVKPVGCGILRLLDSDTAEIKHVWVDSTTRGLGLSRRLMAALEQAALDSGRNVVRLDTHKALTEAAQLYRTSGYSEIPAYGANPHAGLWFEKHLRHS